MDFSGRTVISPDPNLGVHQVAVPRHIALVLTYPQRVNQSNMNEMQIRVLNGHATHPGANLVIKQDGTRFMLRHADKRRTARELQVSKQIWSCNCLVWFGFPFRQQNRTICESLLPISELFLQLLDLSCTNESECSSPNC